MKQHTVGAVDHPAKATNPVIDIVKAAGRVIEATAEVDGTDPLPIQIVGEVQPEGVFFVVGRVATKDDLVQYHVGGVGQITCRRCERRIEIDAPGQRVTGQVVDKRRAVVVAGAVKRAVRINEI